MAVGTRGTDAETTYRGKAGINHAIYDYRGGVSGSDDRSLLRQLFRHTVQFDATGNLGPEKYGGWTFGVSADGYYDRASTDSGSIGTYYAPDLQNLRGALSLFPKTRIPMTLFYTGQHSYAVEYESKNRYVVTTERPTLAVVRKYENRRKAAGAQAMLSVNHAVQVRSSFETSLQRVGRLYDFGENRDIISVITSQREGTNLSEYFIVFSNSLEDSVTIYMDDTVLVRALQPNQQVRVTVESGLHSFDLQSPSYNTFRITRDVNADLNWIIRYNPPSTPNDRDVTANAWHLQGTYQPNDRLRSDLRVDLEKQDDAVLEAITSTRAINNNLSYEVNEQTSLQSLTNFNRLGSINQGGPEEIQGGISQYSAISHEFDERTSFVLAHSLSLLENRGLNTTINTIEATGKRRITRRYAVDLKITGGRMTDSRDFSRNDIGARMNHQYRDLDLYVARSSLTDELEVKASTEYNPGRAQTSYNNRVRLDNDFGRWGKLGSFGLALDYSARWYYDQSGDIFEGKYGANASLTNHEWRRLRVFGFILGERSKTTGSGSQAGQSYSNLTGKLSGTFDLGNGASFIVAGMFVNQEEVDILRFQASLNWQWPGLPVRHSADYQTEEKDYAASGVETFKTFTQKIGFRWRRLEFLMEHEIVFERVRLGSSRYQGLRASLQRGFDL